MKKKKSETTQLKMQETVINSCANSSYQKLQSHKKKPKNAKFCREKKKKPRWNKYLKSSNFYKKK